MMRLVAAPEQGPLQHRGNNTALLLGEMMRAQFPPDANLTTPSAAHSLPCQRRYVTLVCRQRKM